jgi:hypothetical protein
MRAMTTTPVEVAASVKRARVGSNLACLWPYAPVVIEATRPAIPSGRLRSDRRLRRRRRLGRLGLMAGDRPTAISPSPATVHVRPGEAPAERHDQG